MSADFKLDLEKYARIARTAAAEGCVLLKNDCGTLPLVKGQKVAVFGRSAFHYYKSGEGSGGLVNTRYTVGILDALQAEEDITVDGNLLNIYQEWLKENPFDEGQGWGLVPWSQKEMEVTDQVIAAAADADIALIVIGRTAGEDQDNKNEEGSYLLTELERDMIAKVSKTFQKTAVILNAGNIIDMKWVSETGVSAVLYVWQGGQEGGNGVADVLTGRVNPCGKLTDTIAGDITDYPSTAEFGGSVKNYYKEDIYVGYRYFETFARDKVLYPFGYGLSYTTFSISTTDVQVSEDALNVTAVVKNLGQTAGKEVVQVYLKAPQGRLGKPERVLIGFTKTAVIGPAGSETVSLSIPKKVFASYDDSGATGHKSCYVLEAGKYEIYVGADVRTAEYVESYEEQFTVIEQLKEACAPVEHFEILSRGEGSKAGKHIASTRTVNPYQRAKENREDEIPYTGDRGFQLGDVFDKKISLNEFVAQLSDDDLICLFRGEGMCSPKVTPGTAAAFGGITESLRKFGIPAACCADGPSGIRMDCGTKAFSMPNGTLLGCTFDVDLVGQLYQMTALELRQNRIDTLLGPGMNIHRNPLNGRNFEYFSEDPLLTGKMAAAQIRAMEYTSVTGTAKHFAGNNQEADRAKVETVVSERALREIYLKGFEIAVKEGRCRSIMTTYGPLNGIWTAGNYDLNTTILRGEWKFQGIVMTDWWAKANWEGEDGDISNRAPMVMAQNDLYMVTDDAQTEIDNVIESLKNGKIDRSDLQRNAKNILTFILRAPAMLHELGRIDQKELAAMKTEEDIDSQPEVLRYYDTDERSGEVVIDGNEFEVKKGNAQIMGIILKKSGTYEMSVTMKSNLGPLAQLTVSVYLDNILKTTISIQGTEGRWIAVEKELGYIFGNNHYLKFHFGADSLEIDKIRIKLKKERDENNDR